jgi:hypothetical protein
LLVEAVDGFFRVGAVEEFDESESSGPAGFAVNRYDDLGRRSDSSEMRAQICFSRPVGHIADEQTHSHGH